jgi:hypothetical protein
MIKDIIFWSPSEKSNARTTQLSLTNYNAGPQRRNDTKIIPDTAGGRTTDTQMMNRSTGMQISTNVTSS